MEGWIKLHRKIIDNPYYFAEKFCRSMAWIDMLILANHAPGVFYKRGIKISIGSGQLGYDIDTLSKRWKWSRNKVERWLCELENSNQIVRQKSNVTTLITITKYNTYQGNGNAKGKANNKANSKANSKADGHEQEREEEEKKYIYSFFYDNELLKNNDSKYKDFVDFLFGTNGIDPKCEFVLSMNHQISFERYKKLKQVAESNDKGLYDTIRAIENKRPKYTSLYNTLNNWLKQKIRVDVR